MTLIEAIKSGKKYKRIGDREWKEAPCTDPRTGCYYHYLDLIADDWEVKETVVTITDSDFERARERVNKRLYTRPLGHLEYLEELKKELGL